jgi:hypothetical protein
MSFDDLFRSQRPKQKLQRIAAGISLKTDKNSRQKNPMNPSQRIDQLIEGLADWRGKTLASIRRSILEADPEIIEEWKWMGSPVWSHGGIIAVGNAQR